MGKPQNGDELCPSDLDAIVTKPFGLPVVSIARDDAMASAALSGFQFAGSSCNDSGWLMDEGAHEVASLPHFAIVPSLMFLSSYRDVGYLGGLPADYHGFISAAFSQLVVGIPTNASVNATFPSDSLDSDGDECLGEFFTVVRSEFMGWVIATASLFVATCWGVWLSSLRRARAQRGRKHKKKKQKPKKKQALAAPVCPSTEHVGSWVFRERLVCLECRWVGDGARGMRRLKAPRTKARDVCWACANHRLMFWMQGKGATEVQAKAWAQRPRRWPSLWCATLDAGCSLPQ